MTKVGYRTVLIKEDAYQKIKEIAQTNNKSICDTLTEIILTYIEQKQEPQTC